MVESFWSTMQRELLDTQSWPSTEQLSAAVFEWVEGWYNPRRQHTPSTASDGSSRMSCARTLKGDGGLAHDEAPLWSMATTRTPAGWACRRQRLCGSAPSTTTGCNLYDVADQAQHVGVGGVNR